MAVTMGAQPRKADALPAQTLLRVWWYLRDQPSSTSQASAGFCLDTASCSRESGMTVCLVTKAAPAMMCPPLWDSKTWQSIGIMEREHPCWQGSDLLQDSSPNAPSPPLLWSPMGGFSGPEASPGTAPPGHQPLPCALRRGGMPLPKASIPIPGPPVVPRPAGRTSWLSSHTCCPRAANRWVGLGNPSPLNLTNGSRALRCRHWAGPWRAAWQGTGGGTRDRDDGGRGIAGFSQADGARRGFRPRLLQGWRSCQQHGGAANSTAGLGGCRGE